jgi:hypothetical protein
MSDQENSSLYELRTRVKHPAETYQIYFGVSEPHPYKDSNGLSRQERTARTKTLISNVYGYMILNNETIEEVMAKLKGSTSAGVPPEIKGHIELVISLFMKGIESKAFRKLVKAEHNQAIAVLEGWIKDD